MFMKSWNNPPAAGATATAAPLESVALVVTPLSSVVSVEPSS